MTEHFFDCPYCAARISVLVDTSVASQSYVEDCEVCCHPIELSCQCDDDQVTVLSALTADA